MTSHQNKESAVCRLLRKTVLAAAFLTVSLFSLSAADASAETGTSDEYAVKAAYLYNFAKFVEWPAGAFSNHQSSFMICIAGQDPFGDRLEPFTKKTVSGRKISVRRLYPSESPEACHILFISRSEKSQVQATLDQIKNRNILTVSDMPAFSRAGGIISLFLEDDKVRFEINLTAAEKTGLRISSHLLALARRYREGR